MTSTLRRLTFSLLIAMALSNAAPSAFAQAEPASTGAAAPQQLTPDQQAAEHFKRGTAAKNAGNWKAARQAYLEAWKLKKHEQIAAYLGWAEFEQKAYGDATEHLNYFLKMVPAAPQDPEWKRIKDMFDKSRAQVGELKVDVNVDGAEVWIGAKSFGISPLKSPVFIEPGTRTVEARLEGYEIAQETREVKAGAPEEAVSLKLVKTGSGAPPLKPVEGDGKANTAILIAGWSAVGAGAIITAISAGFAISGENRADNIFSIYEGNCDQYPGGREACLQDHKDAKRQWIISGNVAINAGVITAVGLLGMLTYSLWPRAKNPVSTQQKEVAVSVQVERGGGAMTVAMPW